MKTDVLDSGSSARPGAGANRDTPGSNEGRPRECSIEGAFRETRSGWLVLALVWLASLAYLGFYLKDNWIPYDAGTLAQMAERVLHGQLPFRDFVEIYTGGLDYLNALAFRLFGVNLFSIRIPLFLFFAGWVPSVYFIARRFVGPVAAGTVTLLSVAWSVPNYPEAMPSWYNLFFATWGVLALLRYTEGRKARWLWIAGACAGLSFLAKISGLYFIAAALLFFVFRELSLSRRSPAGSARSGWMYRVFASAGLLLFLAVLTELILQRPVPANLLYFVLPGACLVALLVWEVWRGPSPGSWFRLRRLFSMALPFLGGALAPIAIFLGWLVREGAAGAWLSGLLGASFRLSWAGSDPPSPLLAVGLVPAATILVLACHPNPVVRRRTGLAAIAIFALALVLARRYIAFYVGLGVPLAILVPLLALVTLVRLRCGRPLSEQKRQCLFLLAAAAVVCALVQFPFSFPIYFCYVAPLAILAAIGLLSTLGQVDRVALGAVLVFYLAFAVWLRTPGFFKAFQLTPDHPYSLVKIDLPRAGGLRTSAAEAKEYETLVSLVEAHARGPYIYCTPDCPEVYFLADKRNPTKTLFDALDPDFLNVPGRTQRILATIAGHEISVVILRTRNMPSGPTAAGLKAAIDTEFPQSARVGDFEVRWGPWRAAAPPVDWGAFEGDLEEITGATSHAQAQATASSGRALKAHRADISNAYADRDAADQKASRQGNDPPFQVRRDRE